MRLAPLLERGEAGRPLVVVLGHEKRAGERPLAEERAEIEFGPQRLHELLACQFPDMKRIHGAVGRRIHVTVWRADDQNPLRAKDPPDLLQEGSLIVEVLDGLKGNDDVEGGVGTGEAGGVAGGEPEVVGAIAFARVGDRLLANVDADDRARGLRQIGAAETFARGGIEDIAAAAEFARKKVSVEMLVHRLPLAVEGEALAGEAKLPLRLPRLEDFAHLASLHHPCLSSQPLSSTRPP